MFDFPRRMFAAVAFASALALALAPLPAIAAEPSVTPGPPQGILAFVAAYPDFLVGIEEGHLRWRDGMRMPLDRLGLDRDGKPKVRYRPARDPALAATEAISAVDYEPVFLKMYGDCRKDDMAKRLTAVAWNRGARGGGMELKAARANGVAEALQRVSDALDQMPAAIDAIQRAVGGTFVCRTISRSARLSLHGFGIAIDVNPADGGYWQTAKTDALGKPIRRNVVPMPIVEAFEREGFVWGGRWNQFDTFHFEYRPEYHLATGGALPDRLTRPTFSAFFGGRGSAAIERRSFAPPGTSGVLCHRWVRQPGKNFGRCLSVTIPAKKSRR